jgi:hypothetical protein
MEGDVLFWLCKQKGIKIPDYLVTLADDHDVFGCSINRYFGPLSHNFRLGGWVRPYIPPYMMASIGGHHTTASPVLNT